MKVVILCGGKGTRIRDVSETVPKPMLQIGNRPILWHIMKIYSKYGFNDFILCLGYKGHIIKNYFLNYYAMTNDITIDLTSPNSIEFHDNIVPPQWRVTLADTGEETMTGARVAMVLKYLDEDDHFMLTYGDGVANIDIDKLIKYHIGHGKLVTVTGVHPAGRFGELELSAGNIVTSFAEKPQVSEGRINGGFFVMQKEFIYRYLSEDEDLVLEKAPLTNCAKDGELVSFNHDGFWQPMDTHREYHILNQLWSEGKAPWKV